MRILLTAIGSMSAACAINSLKEAGHYVVGCDIYPGEWHYETTLCDYFYQAPYATQKDDYIQFLLDICKKEALSHVIPLTDLEIDVIKENRRVFEGENIVICTQSDSILDIVRNKYELYRRFKNDSTVPSIKTCLLSEIPENFQFPCIAKPFNGRSSEGLMRNASKKEVLAIPNKADYILQEQIEGPVFTVDYCRDAQFNKDVAIPREELLRTKNGAGLTVRTCSDPKLLKLVSHIGNSLEINGCLNMEFILANGQYYLIDINPRFSAGLAFSKVAGYDMATNHLRCFIGDEIDNSPTIIERIIIKRYDEVVE